MAWITHIYYNALNTNKLCGLKASYYFWISAAVIMANTQQF